MANSQEGRSYIKNNPDSLEQQAEYNRIKCKRERCDGLHFRHINQMQDYRKGDT